MTPAELQDWRIERGVSQERLARLLGVHEMTVSRWERGASTIPPFLELALASLRVEPAA